MRQLIDSVTIERPVACADCIFRSYDADNGYLCCGDLMPRHSYKINEVWHHRDIVSPGDALEHNRACMFIQGEETKQEGVLS